MDLVLSLGHNASAIVVDNGYILCGYEEERMSGVKSDSRYPLYAIGRLQERYGESFDNVYIGHWFVDAKLTHSKYCNIDHLSCLAPNAHWVDKDFTHHDSHFRSAKVFAKHYNFSKSYHAAIIDGFGTFGECFSVYEVKDDSSTLIARKFGYDNSLGLLYQYATAFMEMKMHNHEYKILGYEAHIHECAKKTEIDILNILIQTHSEKWFKRNDVRSDPMASNSALAHVKFQIHELLTSVLEAIKYENKDIYDKRVVLSYFVQGLVENVVVKFLESFDIKNLLVSGGLFYNVKLNSILADRYSRFCVMPLAGDQGAGLGVYDAYAGDLIWPGHLFWGKRDLDPKFLFNHGIQVINSKSTDEIYQALSGALLKDGYVNFIRGDMEFGPRALCNTSTLALPSMVSVNNINKMNGRTTIMPMAPVMTEEQAAVYLQNKAHIFGSLEYMVVTRQVNQSKMHNIRGATHVYSDKIATCRPQITKDPLMVELLNEFGPLINTSFNVHGVPICFHTQDIIHSHMEQNKISKIKTVVVI